MRGMGQGCFLEKCKIDMKMGCLIYLFIQFDVGDVQKQVLDEMIGVCML